MVKLVKSAVKCYKKKTKKTVGGRKKTYEYNQYLVPLKRSDNLDCSMEVFIIPQKDLEDYIAEDGEFKDLSSKEEEYRIKLEQYEAEFADLEWKHSQLSKSYKELFNKHNRSRRKEKELEDKIESLESDREKLIHALEEERKLTKKLKLQQQNQKENKTSPPSDQPPKTDKIDEDTKNKDENEDKDLWTVLKSRLTKKEDEKED
jgi:chromosome segregation ATPase